MESLHSYVNSIFAGKNILEMNNGLFMLATLVAYFLILLVISRRAAGRSDNDTFFRAGRQSSWPLVAFGMIGASISGVSFVSVPGWVAATGMTYLQMCAGFFVGYVAVAFILLPLYYRLRLTSIYDYLEMRYGPAAHRTGALFFLLSKLTGAAARLYLVCLVLQEFVAAPLGVPYPVTVLLILLLIWLYTRRGGIQTLVRTDALQTLCLLLALGGVMWIAARQMGLTPGGVVRTVVESPMCRVFEWNASSSQAFWRQFLSGVFIVIVMTGLDQDMMQKNLTCRTLREAQKDMCVYGISFLPVNLLFLALGILLHAFCASQGIVPPASGDELLPSLVASGALGTLVILPFTIGIVAAAFSSADSAVTAITTSCCIDLLGIERRNLPAGRAERIRRRVHLLTVAAFLGCILLFRALNSTSVIDAIYVMASYTYGPLLGLYVFGLFTHRRAADCAVPFVALGAPLLCALLDYAAPRLWGYVFGYELLMLNGLLTMAGLWVFSSREVPN